MRASERLLISHLISSRRLFSAFVLLRDLSAHFGVEEVVLEYSTIRDVGRATIYVWVHRVRPGSGEVVERVATLDSSAYTYVCGGAVTRQYVVPHNIRFNTTGGAGGFLA